MSPITRRDFQSALPLPPSVLANLEENLALGWVDAGKLHHQSAQFRIKIDEARESIASNLGISPVEVEFVGELGFGFWSALAGLIQQPTLMRYSAIDRQIVHAFARSNEARGGRSELIQPDSLGAVDYSCDSEKAVLVWQGTNREIGVEQAPPRVSKEITIFADMTARFEPNSLPPDWDVALWDPRSFGGPEGIAILGIRNGSRWRSPIPQIDQRRLFGSFSKPLLIAAAQSLEIWSKAAIDNRRHIAQLNQLLRREIQERVPAITAVGDHVKSDPRFVALHAGNVIAEEVLREMERMGFLIDAGSACSASALAPSHVLAALGYGSDGHLRVTLKEEHTEGDISALVAGLASALAKQGSSETRF